MLRKAYSILAVVTASASVACSGAIDPSVHQETRQQLADELSNTSLADALKHREHFAPLCDGQGYPLPGNINSKGSGTSVAEFCDAINPPDAQTTPKPDATPDATSPKADAGPDASADATSTCDLKSLNQELSFTLLDDAVKDHAHFRCICDDQGYPLVGNINAKGATASQFCAAIKEKGLL